MSSRSDPGYVCCFCGEHIARSDQEPLELSVRGQEDPEEQQLLFAHLNCFIGAMHARIPLLFAGYERD